MYQIIVIIAEIDSHYNFHSIIRTIQQNVNPNNSYVQF